MADTHKIAVKRDINPVDIFVAVHNDAGIFQATTAVGVSTGAGIPPGTVAVIESGPPTATDLFLKVTFPARKGKTILKPNSTGHLSITLTNTTEGDHVITPSIDVVFI